MSISISISLPQAQTDEAANLREADDSEFDEARQNLYSHNGGGKGRRRCAAFELP